MHFYHQGTKDTKTEENWSSYFVLFVPLWFKY
jgi:hypothetical protein